MLSPDRFRASNRVPGPCRNHSPDFSAVYRRGMASQARADVNLDDGAAVGGGRRQAGQAPIKFSGKGAFLVIRYLALPDKPILQFKDYRRSAKSGYGRREARQIAL